VLLESPNGIMPVAPRATESTVGKNDLVKEVSATLIRPLLANPPADTNGIGSLVEVAAVLHQTTNLLAQFRVRLRFRQLSLWLIEQG
jgi:hypothetical protein